MVFTPEIQGNFTTYGQIRDSFSPNRWLYEVRRFRDRSLHMAQTIKTFNFTGNAGDTVHIPLIGRLAVHDRIPNQAVRIQNPTPSTYTAKIDKDRETTLGIDKNVGMFSQYPYRKIYTQEVGYALRRDVDNAMLALRAAVAIAQQIFRSTGTGAGTAAGDPAPLDNSVILAAIQAMLEADVDITQCRWVFSPNQVMDLAGLDVFRSNEYNLATMKNGIIGTLYNLPVHVTTQITNNSLDGYINGDGATPEPTPGVLGSYYLPTQDSIVGTGLPRGKTGAEVAQPFQTGMLVHPEWGIFLKQSNISTTMSWENTLQAEVVVATQCYGAKLYRGDHVVLIHSRGT